MKNGWVELKYFKLEGTQEMQVEDVERFLKKVVEAHK